MVVVKVGAPVLQMSLVEVQQSRAFEPARARELSGAIGRAGLPSKIKMTGLPGPIRILDVDDEPSTRMLLKRWIKRSMAVEGSASVTQSTDAAATLPLSVAARPPQK